MTANQISHAQARETRRANEARETETRRSNLEKEREARRSRHAENTRTYAKLAGEGVLTGLKEMGASSRKAAEVVAGIVGKANDPSWYLKDPQLAKDSGTFSFNYPVFTEGVETDRYYNTKFVKPGYVVVHYVPTLGSLGSSSEVGGVAAQSFYSYIRHANAGSRNYEPSDLMIYILAVTDIYSRISWLSRLYSIANTYKFHNRGYGRGLLASLTSVTVAEDIMNNLADFRAAINRMILKAGTLCLPRDISLVARRSWLNTVILKDEGIHGSVDYVYSPDFFYTFAYNADDMGCLLPIGINTSSLANMLDGFDSALNAIFADEDCGIMAGDILKAYGPEGVYQLNQLTEDYHIESIFSLEALSQLKNATCAVLETNSLSNDITGIGNLLGITQTTSTHIICYGDAAGAANASDSAIYPTIQATLPGSLKAILDADSLPSTVVLDMYKDDVSVEDVMVATRFMHGTRFFKSVSATESQYMYPAAGTEIITWVDIGLQYLSGSFLPNTAAYGRFTDKGDPSAACWDADLFTKCNWLPVFSIFDAGLGDISAMNGGMHNFTFLTPRNLQALSMTAVFSEVSVPLNGLVPRKF